MGNVHEYRFVCGKRELLWSEGKLQWTAQRAIKAAFIADNCSFYNTILQLSLLKSELPRKEVERSN